MMSKADCGDSAKPFCKNQNKQLRIPFLLATGDGLIVVVSLQDQISSPSHTRLLRCGFFWHKPLSADNVDIWLESDIK